MLSLVALYGCGFLLVTLLSIGAGTLIVETWGWAFLEYAILAGIILQISLGILYWRIIVRFDAWLEDYLWDTGSPG
jgi:hypothetical protein